MDVICSIEQVIYSLFGRDKLVNASSVVEVSRNLDRCDLTTNAALVVAKLVKRDPREMAGIIVDQISQLNHPDISSLKVEGPGFINIFLVPSAWLKVLVEIDQAKAAYGDCQIADGRSVNLEFVSANPTGPLHVGHARGAIIFDALGNLLAKIGYKVTKEYYVNDSGSQIDGLIDTAFYRYQEALGLQQAIEPSVFYPGVYLKVVGKNLAECYGDKLCSYAESERKLIVKDKVLHAMLDLIKKDLALLKVKHDVFVRESEVASEAKVQEVVRKLESRNLIYKDKLQVPMYEPTSDNWEAKENILFKAKKYGDSSDRSLTKGVEGWTYFAKDVAYHYDKLCRDYDHMIVGLGRDHAGYVKRLKAIVNALSDGEVVLDVQLYNVVKFFDDGVPLKMSKRSGSFLSIWDVVNRLGSDVVRFVMLTRHQNADLDFDFKQITEQSKDNPVFYVHYAYARVQSIVTRFNHDLSVDSVQLTLLQKEKEINIIKFMSKWPGTVIAAAKSREPHRIVFYLMYLAELFHSLWSLGKQDNSFRFIDDDNIELSKARVFMIRSIGYVLSSGLNVLNIDLVEKM